MIPHSRDSHIKLKETSRGTEMGYFGPGLGLVVVPHQHVNTQVLKGCDASMMTVSTELFGFIPHLIY
jgi:hypothetical protein